VYPLKYIFIIVYYMCIQYSIRRMYSYPLEGLGGLGHYLPDLRPDVHPQNEADVEIPERAQVFNKAAEENT
jgi:hypothetical protein